MLARLCVASREAKGAFMKLGSTLAAAGAGLFLCAVASGSASAQATRTWVSGVGDDANPCSRTAPCKTLHEAHSQTAPGGVISVLDGGGYGAVTITKSISIENNGAEAAILASGGISGVIVNGADVIVHLRGLVIDGGRTGAHGVRFVQGAALHIENSIIRGMVSSGAGNGVLFAPSGPAELDIVDTVIADNGSGVEGAGVLIKPSAGGSAKASLTRVDVLNNVSGVRADGTNGPITLVARELNASGNAYSGLVGVSPAGGSAVNIMANASLLSNNGTGVHANGSAVTIRVGRSTITGNGTNVSNLASGVLLSYGNNQLDGTASDGAFSGSVPQR